MNQNVFDWLLRFLKGMLIGTGAILPGVSGGALAAVFGIYERLIGFISHISKDFKKNFLFFLPVGLGGIFSVFMVSFGLSFFFERYEVQMLWFFVGCIIGILPMLYKQAGKEGRSANHIGVMVITTIALLLFLYNVENLITTSLPLNFTTWFMAGAVFALGFIIPGLSPSNFLLYLGLYKLMVDAIKNVDLSILFPLMLGAVLTVLILSKLFDFIFKKAYGFMFHFILGVIFASTIMIIPRDYNYLSMGAIVCIVTCLSGIVFGKCMSNLERKYK